MNPTLAAALRELKRLEKEVREGTREESEINTDDPEHAEKVWSLVWKGLQKNAREGGFRLQTEADGTERLIYLDGNISFVKHPKGSVEVKERIQ